VAACHCVINRDAGFGKKEAPRANLQFFASFSPVTTSEDIRIMRRIATLILFALVAGAMVFGQNPPGTNNNPATAPQTQNPTVPAN